MSALNYLLTIVLGFAFSVNAFAHDEEGESFQLSGTITSIELSETGGVINVSANAGRYGKVYLTYNVKLNPSVPDQGYFHGRGTGINDAGERNSGSRQGVFRREGAKMYFYSLDDVSDGILNYCETVMDLRDETVEMTFYPF